MAVRRTASFTAAATSLTSGWCTAHDGMSVMRCDPSWNRPIFGDAGPTAHGEPGPVAVRRTARPRPRSARRARPPRRPRRGWPAPAGRCRTRRIAGSRDMGDDEGSAAARRRAAWVRRGCRGDPPRVNASCALRPAFGIVSERAMRERQRSGRVGRLSTARSSSRGRAAGASDLDPPAESRSSGRSSVPWPRRRPALSTAVGRRSLRRRDRRRRPPPARARR